MICFCMCSKINVQQCILSVISFIIMFVLTIHPVVQVHLKDLITAVVSRRRAYRLREGRFQYAFGSDVAPQPYLKNSLAAYHTVTE